MLLKMSLKEEKSLSLVRARVTVRNSTPPATHIHTPQKAKQHLNLSSFTALWCPACSFLTLLHFFIILCRFYGD